MLKKIITLLNVTVFSLFCNAQVGIGVTNPEATLDINGTLKIRNVSSGKSNVAADNALFTDKEGLVVSRKILPSLLVGTGTTGDNMSSASISTSSGERKTPAIFSKTFTVSEKSMVLISGSISYGTVRQADGNTRYDSGETVLIGCELAFDEKPSTYSTALIQDNSVPFTSYNDHSSGYNYVTGSYHLTLARTLILDPGTYTIHVKGKISVPFATSDHGAFVRFGLGNDDYIDAVAFPI